MSEDKEKNSDTSEQDTEEKKEADAKSEDDTTKKVDSDESNDSEDKGEAEEVDYKSEFERLQGELAKKNERIEKQDKKIIKLKRKEENSDEEVDEVEETEDKPDVKELVNQAITKQMSAFVEDTIEDELGKISSSEDEKKLIKWYFDNRIVKSGWSKKEVVSYLEDAKILANKGKMLSKMKIIAKKTRSDETSGSPAFAGTPPKASPKVTEYDRKQAEKFFNGDVKKWMKYKPN